ncbi:MAG: THUMP domain-containing protein [Thermoplasmatota archaeon]
MQKLRQDDTGGILNLVLYLIRFAELGLKSEKVRRRFVQSLLRDIEDRLAAAGVEHFIERERGRIYVEASNPEGTVEVLRRIPGIQSFSPVDACSSDRKDLMDKLSEVGRERIRSGMSYGLKVRRRGNTPYTSQEIAVEGGGAVVSHLREGENRVDLKNPDIWIEVEIRRDRAYVFTERIPGIGGMPSATQGKAVLYLPPADGDAEDDGLTARAALSWIFLERRGTRVIPASLSGHEKAWRGRLESTGIKMDQDPFILEEGDLKESLISAASKIGARVVAFPVDFEGISELPVVHDGGFPAAVFYPTAAMDDGEVRIWLARMTGSSVHDPQEADFSNHQHP